MAECGDTAANVSEIKPFISFFMLNRRRIFEWHPIRYSNDGVSMIIDAISAFRCAFHI